LSNDFSVEPAIKAETEWITTMPTKRFYATTASAVPPFARFSSGGEDLDVTYYDREQSTPGAIFCLFPQPCGRNLPFVTTSTSWIRNGGTTSAGKVLGSLNIQAAVFGLNTNWINGWAEFRFYAFTPARLLFAPAGMTMIIDAQSGAVTAKANVAYAGLPVLGFAAQSYSTTGLPGINPNVLSNYGGLFNHRYRRQVSVLP
jgi:hypothetical protein